MAKKISFLSGKYYVCSGVRLIVMIYIALVVLVYVVVSVLTYNVYAYDKHKARHYKQRVPEVYMHMLEFIGGWPGGFIAQQVKHHKNSKWQYQSIFWLIVLIHLLFWALFIFSDTSIFDNKSYDIPPDSLNSLKVYMDGMVRSLVSRA